MRVTVARAIAEALAVRGAAVVVSDIVVASAATAILKPAVDLLPERDRAAAASMSPFNRVGEPRGVAEVVGFLAGDAARWVTGQNLGAGGG